MPGQFSAFVVFNQLGERGLIQGGEDVRLVGRPAAESEITALLTAQSGLAKQLD